MSEQKHTTGTWVVGYGNGLTGPTTANVVGPTVAGSNYPFTVVSVGKETIAIVPKQTNGVMEANARLIAAAPELLEALRILVAVAEKLPGTHGLAIDNAYAALNKALGR